MERRPLIKGKMPGVNENERPAPILPGETPEEAAKRLGIETIEQAQKRMGNEAWENAEYEARRRLVENNGDDLPN